MIVRLLTAGALIAATLGAAPVAPPMPTILDLGSAKLIAQNDASAQLAGMQIAVPAGLDRESAAQNGLAALSAEAVLTTPAGLLSLRDTIAARGGSLTYVVGQQSVRFYLEAAPDAMPALADLFAHALAAPDTAAATLAKARAGLRARIADDERNPVAVGIAMLRQSYYDGGAGLPALGTAASIALLGPSDVRNFIAQHYRRGGTIVTVVGNVNDDVTNAGKALVAALPDGTAVPVLTQTRALGVNAKRIVTHREIGVPYVVLGFAAPSLGDKDFGAMLIVRSLLSDVFDRQSATTLPVYARAVGVVYDYEAKPSSLAVYVNGGQLDPTAGLGSVDAVLRGIAARSLSTALLKRYKISAHGEWETESISLQDRAWSIGNFVEQGISPDYAHTALAAIDATTGADVKRVVAKYLQRFTVALVLPRDAASAD